MQRGAETFSGSLTSSEEGECRGAQPLCWESEGVSQKPSLSPRLRKARETSNEEGECRSFAGSLRVSLRRVVRRGSAEGHSPFAGSLRVSLRNHLFPLGVRKAPSVRRAMRRGSAEGHSPFAGSLRVSLRNLLFPLGGWGVHRRPGSRPHDKGGPEWQTH